MAFNKLTATREELLEIIERQRQKIEELQANEYNPTLRTLYKGEPLMIICNNGAERWYQGQFARFIRYAHDEQVLVKLLQPNYPEDRGQNVLMPRHNVAFCQPPMQTQWHKVSNGLN